jgi:hypothetical protein
MSKKNVFLPPDRKQLKSGIFFENRIMPDSARETNYSESRAGPYKPLLSPGEPMCYYGSAKHFQLKRIAQPPPGMYNFAQEDPVGPCPNRKTEEPKNRICGGQNAD